MGLQCLPLRRTLNVLFEDRTQVLLLAKKDFSNWLYFQPFCKYCYETSNMYTWPPEFLTQQCPFMFRTKSSHRDIYTDHRDNLAIFVYLNYIHQRIQSKWRPMDPWFLFQCLSNQISNSWGICVKNMYYIIIVSWLEIHQWDQHYPRLLVICISFSISKFFIREN